MYRCSVELSVQYDGQTQSESEHASLIDQHDSFNSVAKQIRSVFLNTGFDCMINTLVQCLQFCSETLPTQFDMLDFNPGFALVVRAVNTIFPKKLPDGTLSGTYSSI